MVVYGQLHKIFYRPIFLTPLGYKTFCFIHCRSDRIVFYFSFPQHTANIQYANQ